jgi:hypothetical protein
LGSVKSGLPEKRLITNTMLKQVRPGGTGRGMRFNRRAAQGIYFALWLFASDLLMLLVSLTAPAEHRARNEKSRNKTPKETIPY